MLSSSTRRAGVQLIADLLKASEATLPEESAQEETESSPLVQEMKDQLNHSTAGSAAETSPKVVSVAK